MGFLKVLKTNAYFKRYQVKYRRRREGKTDYRQRRALITQDKNKYLTPKYRLVARITNKDVICQIVSAEIRGDRTHASAYGHELPKFGLPVGLTNYAACYCTGLLCARRLLTLKKLSDKYAGVKEVDGKHYEPEHEERRPFKALLDIGLARPTVGHRVFACLKGAVDGGILIPHGDARFAGYKGGNLDAAALRDRILGKHISVYMKSMEEEDPDKYKAHFSRYVKAGVKGGELGALYKKVHAAIKKDPGAKDPAKHTAERREKQKSVEQKDFRKKEMRAYTLAQRRNRVQQKVDNIRAKVGMGKRGRVGLEVEGGGGAEKDDDEE